MKREITQEEKEVFQYLNDLRESGATNMFGAVPYIQDEFSMEYNEAKSLLLLWMKNFKPDGIYETIEAA